MSKDRSRKSRSPPPSSRENQISGHLLPAAEIPDNAQPTYGLLQGTLSSPAEIQRPRSALHSGNFTEGIKRTRGKTQKQGDDEIKGDSTAHLPGAPPITPWYTPSLDKRSIDDGLGTHGNERYPEWGNRRQPRSRAPSLQSYSSSYVLQAPTTPLVQQSNSEDLDLSNISSADLSSDSDKSTRRHTLPPNLLPSGSEDSPAIEDSPNQPFSARRVASLPYQAHKPRRSLTSALSLRSVSSPQTPRVPRVRRSSHSSESVALHRASMVGSYEESILRGWMSTAPSQPLEFTAQIGAAGKKGCKPKCPAHVTLPFPAVFYSYGTSAGSSQGMLDEPSPYVGQIDLNQLPRPIEAESGNSHKRRLSPALPDPDRSRVGSGPEDDNEDGSLRRRKRKKRIRTPSPSEIPPGSYRIPQQGQLQIVIKNPDKTAMKLFLVPYDLTGMEAGTKTFIRQKCYSTGPSADYALTSQGDGSRFVQVGTDARKKPALRYLIHVNICSPSSGCFYLYHHIRVVFANRVSDNKEQLQNEIQMPQPRYSTYKPSTDATTPSSSVGANLAAEKAYRRRSSGFGYGSEKENLRATQSLGGASNYPYMSKSPPPPVPAIPFGLDISPIQPPQYRRPGFDGASDDDVRRPNTATSDVQSPSSDKTSHFEHNLSGSFRSNSSNSSGSYAKLARGENGYGGLFGRPSTPEPGEGLLARRLKGLGLERGERAEGRDI